ncbi:DISEASE RESISTANCE PROTEIN RP [Salix koriyanagi]|uniref:DISEASE RESISTANCE PROTEIN RP n=1 Tax=Salix koriyanagi TaxID=2511006 RepID=A0A9Q0VCZ8_9ROSI|nr:DISEASE RESISTANCE PROTEIN RP [Salix koriyanagi]
MCWSDSHPVVARIEQSSRVTIRRISSMDFVSPLIGVVHSLCISVAARTERDDLKRQVGRAEVEGLTCTSQVKGWLQRVEDIEAESSSVIEDLGRGGRRCVGRNACCSSYKLSKKASKLLSRATELIGKGAFDVVADNPVPDAVEEVPSRPAVGLNMMSHHFDVVIWVVVSKEFVADKIQRAVGARLGLPWEESEGHEERAQKIYRLMRRKKFLLLLDDVWEGIDLLKVGIPVPEKTNRCKVIFTARSLHVCTGMNAHQKLRVEFLGEEDSWKLFCENVGEKGILDSETIRAYAETVVRKCGGLPLALITIGKAMANKETEEEWNYDNLETDALRSCFLYCSLFPEDYSIEKELLIELHACLKPAKRETQVKMHDVVRSFALWIASECELSNRFLVEASTGLTEAPGADNWKHALRISLFDNGITTLAEIPECPRLSTLLLQWNSGLNKISNAFFQFMPALRVLDLSFTSLREIPASISELVELRHLDLSGTKITSLPKELGGLTKLQHLDLQRTHSLRIIPREAISGLLQLRILNVYYSYGVWEQQDNEVGFADLQCLKHLTTLGITIDELNTLKRLYSFSGLLKVIQYLYIIQCDGLFYLQLSLNSSFGKRLRRLSINNCYDLQYLQVDEEAGQKWLPSLEVVELHGLPNLETVWKNPVTRESLQNLRSVNIWHCRRLRNVSWVIQLPKLEVIYLMYCKEMEEVVSRSGIAGEDSKAFQSLRTLSIRDLPKLRSITPWELAFPSLESIAVIDCPKLKQLSIKTHNTPALPTVYGNKEWWDGLEWNEASSETALYPHFMPI